MRSLKRNFYSVILSVLSISCLSLGGCGESASSKGVGAISTSLTWSEGKAAKAVARVPVGVTTVRIAITGPTITEIVKEFDASAGGGIIDNVPAATDLTITATAISYRGTPMYSGKVTGVSVVAGQTTEVATVMMYAELESITVTPDRPTILIQSTKEFRATGTYVGGITDDITWLVTWSSSDTSVATIGRSGTAGSVGFGTATITATLGTISGSTQLTVLPDDLLSLSITPDNAGFVLGGAPQQFHVTGTRKDYSVFDATTSVAWSSSDTSVATVSETGVVTVLAPGSTTIKVTWEGVEATTLLTVVNNDGTSNFYTYAGFFPTQGARTHTTGMPTAVALDASDNIYVANMYQDTVFKYSGAGVYLSQIGSFGTGDGQLMSPTGVALDSDGNIYVVDHGNNRIQKYNSSRLFINKWGEYGSGDGQFSGPTDIAVDRSGNVYVTDSQNGRVQKFDKNGVFLTKWGTNGSGDGEFSNPAGIAVDSAGCVFVVDQDNDRIQKFNSSGTFTIKWGTRGAEPGQLLRPSGIYVDNQDNVFVADSGNNRINKYSAEGTFITSFRSPTMGQARDVAIDSRGDALVVDGDAGGIAKFVH